MVDKCISVIGLGYVGLPLAQAFGRVSHVIAYDCDNGKINCLEKGIDPSKECAKESFENTDVKYTNNPSEIAAATFHIIAVPTPVDGRNHPNLNALKNASSVVGKHIKKGDVIVFESTVYPGCTEEVCIPILEMESGLEYGNDFGVGYSPERINPGDREHTIENVVKVVSGSDEGTLERICNVYSKVVKAGIHRAPSIKVAEAAKIIENTQRDVNIALMNELSIIFSKMGIDTLDVISAARTKWNFLPFQPGLVGGHCIGVDPYYLDYKARELGYNTQIINRGRYVNDSMGRYVADETAKRMSQRGLSMKQSRVLVMGVAYKENVSDIRNSKTVDIVEELGAFGIEEIDIYDPVVDSKLVEEMYGLTTVEKIDGKYDAIIVAVAHRVFEQMLKREFFDEHLSDNGVISDVKGIYNEKDSDIDVWRL